jgi:hypothetical protein
VLKLHTLTHDMDLKGGDELAGQLEWRVLSSQNGNAYCILCVMIS